WPGGFKGDCTTGCGPHMGGYSYDPFGFFPGALSVIGGYWVPPVQTSSCFAGTCTPGTVYPGYWSSGAGSAAFIGGATTEGTSGGGDNWGWNFTKAFVKGFSLAGRNGKTLCTVTAIDNLRDELNPFAFDAQAIAEGGTHAAAEGA